MENCNTLGEGKGAAGMVAQTEACAGAAYFLRTPAVSTKTNARPFLTTCTCSACHRNRRRTKHGGGCCSAHVDAVARDAGLRANEQLSAAATGSVHERRLAHVRTAYYRDANGLLLRFLLLRFLLLQDGVGRRSTVGLRRKHDLPINTAEQQQTRRFNSVTKPAARCTARPGLPRALPTQPAQRRTPAASSRRPAPSAPRSCWPRGWWGA
jgi:hypothetical protein